MAVIYAGFEECRQELFREETEADELEWLYIEMLSNYDDDEKGEVFDGDGFEF